jgi:hypothetical protein
LDQANGDTDDHSRLHRIGVLIVVGAFDVAAAFGGKFKL